MKFPPRYIDPPAQDNLYSRWRVRLQIVSYLLSGLIQGEGQVGDKIIGMFDAD